MFKDCDLTAQNWVLGHYHVCIAKEQAYTIKDLYEQHEDEGDKLLGSSASFTKASWNLQCFHFQYPMTKSYQCESLHQEVKDYGSYCSQ